MFGLEPGPRLNDLRDSLTGVLAFSENPLSLLPAVQRAAGWTRPMRLFARLTRRSHELMSELVAERRAAEQAGEEGGDDVLAMLLEARHDDGSPMSDAELRDELMTARRRRPRDDRVAARVGVRAARPRTARSQLGSPQSSTPATATAT